MFTGALPFIEGGAALASGVSEVGRPRSRTELPSRARLTPAHHLVSPPPAPHHDHTAPAAHAGPPIRVVYCIDNMNVGGTELNAVRTAERLDRRRFHLSVACLRADGPILERYRAAGIDVAEFPVGRLYGPGALRQLARMVRHFRDERAQIVHCHDAYTSLFGTLAARLAGVPVVIASRRTWKSPHLTGRIWAASKYAYRMADVVLANSPTVGQLVRDEAGLPASRVAVIPNFVDSAAFEPLEPTVRMRLRDELSLPADAITVGVIARLMPVKDHATLVRAVARLAATHPRLHLVLVGDGPSRPQLEALVAERAIADRVHFAGMRPSLPNLHALFEISALTSVSEAFPNSLVEAMAAGRPVVASRVGGNPDAVREGETGLLFPVGDDAALAEALDRLLRDGELRARMGSAAVRVARQAYGDEQVLAALAELYEGLLARRAGKRQRAVTSRTADGEASGEARRAVAS